MATRVMSGRFSRSHEVASSVRGRFHPAAGSPRRARRFDLRTNVALGVDQQLFGGEQHLNLAHSRHLANGGFDLAGAGRAIHAFYQPAKACMTQRVVFSGGFAAAGVVRTAAFRRLRGRGKF